MRAYRLFQYGIESLHLVQEHLLEPGPGQVRVKVCASSLNFRDILIMKGKLHYGSPLGHIPLSDASGVIEAIGPDVRRFKIGDRVINSFFPDWFGGQAQINRTQYGIEHDGWLCEYKIVQAEALSAMPAHLSFEEAATLPCAALTAWTALAGINAGDTVLTQGTGGVSIFAIQFAKTMGATVIATTSTQAKLDRLRNVGADQVINYRQNPEWALLARHYTNGQGVNRIVEVGGPLTIAQSIKAIALGGQVSLIGSLGKSPEKIDVMDLFFSQATYQAIGVGSRSDLEDMNRLISQHQLRPIIDRVFDFEDAPAAYDYFLRQDKFGKVVIRHDR